MEQGEDVSNVDGKTQTVEESRVLPYQTNMWFQLKTFLTSTLLLIALCFGASSKQAGQETWIDIGAIVVEVGPGVVAAIKGGEFLGKLDYLSKPLAKTQAPSVNPVSSGGVATNNADDVFETGANITPNSTLDNYPSIGANGTFVTEVNSIENVIGPIADDVTVIRITPQQADELEHALGISGNLEDINTLFIIDDIPNRCPRCPIEGNDQFLGGEQGLPGGGSELVIDSIPSTGGDGIRQIRVIVE